MTADAFDRILHRRTGLIASVLASKPKEYATADRMHNFKVAASLLNVTPMKALVGMWVKHIVSVLDLVEAHAITGNVPTKTTVDEKVGDSVNYLILLEGLFEEARIEACESELGLPAPEPYWPPVPPEAGK